VTDEEREIKGFKEEYDLDTPLSNEGIKQAEIAGKHIAAKLLEYSSG
jgi:broad specificity phosphatase PhoE